jgi:hypothetical protein
MPSSNSLRRIRSHIGISQWIAKARRKREPSCNTHLTKLLSPELLVEQADALHRKCEDADVGLLARA